MLISQNFCKQKYISHFFEKLFHYKSVNYCMAVIYYGYKVFYCSQMLPHIVFYAIVTITL